MNTLRDLIRAEQYPQAWRRLRELARRTDGYADFAALCRFHQKLAARGDGGQVVRRIKVALLGTGTTDLIAPALVLALDARELGCEIQKADYGTYAREMLDPASQTAQFRPDVAVIVNSPTTLPTRPTPDDDAAAIAARVREVTDHWLGLCRALHDHAGCEIVLDNYHLLTPSPHGNLATKLPWDLNTFVRRINLELGAAAPPFVHINDVDALSAQEGLARWFDPRRWYEAKLPVALQCVPAYVRSQARIIAALSGRSAKCLVLDLDNTIWGGVVGDDGVDGIKIGQGDPEGEAFLAFQQYVIEISRRGILLAVCSKNAEANAWAPFDHRTEMVIKREDLVCFKANWEPKPDNLRAIARELNIGLDALVFVDDNPREREHVRQQLPEVRVVELTEDAADYPRLLAETGWLEAVHITSEDRARTSQYRSNAARSEMQVSTDDYAGYLASLNQQAVIGPYEAAHLDRIAQLINKTNQFNLTTRRQTRSDVETEAGDPQRLTAFVRLADRFGDNGLISVFSSVRRGDECDIDQWLMSCRVLSRGVERLLLNWVVERARAAGVRTIRGTFIPTDRNGLVEHHYAALGFSRIENDGSTAAGTTCWRLSLDGYVPLDVAIDRVDDY